MRKIVLLSLIILSLSFSSKKLTWVAIGDSITYLNEHQDETGNRISEGYMSRVVEALPEITYLNQGHNGWTSGGIADKIESLGIVKADLYTVFLGTNDWWQGRRVGDLTDYIRNNGNTTVFGSFRIITDKLRNLNPAAKIILITPMQRADFVYINDMKNNAWGSYKEKNNQSLADFAKAVKTIGSYEKFPVIDLYNDKKLNIRNLVKFKRMKNPQTGTYMNYAYPKYTGIPFNPEEDEYPYPMEAIQMTYDGLHPSDQGYEHIAQRLIEVIKTLNLDL